MPLEAGTTRSPRWRPQRLVTGAPSPSSPQTVRFEAGCSSWAPRWSGPTGCLIGSTHRPDRHTDESRLLLQPFDVSPVWEEPSRAPEQSLGDVCGAADVAAAEHHRMHEQGMQLVQRHSLSPSGDKRPLVVVRREDLLETWRPEQH